MPATLTFDNGGNLNSLRTRKRLPPFYKTFRVDDVEDPRQLTFLKIDAEAPDIETVPVIYTRYSPPMPMSLIERAMAFCIGVCCLGVLCIAAWLRPNHDGIGTHRQLGLAACSFKIRTDLPCPSCGYTTAFAYFAHGNPVASFYTQPMGALLALACAVTVWIGFHIAITGRPVHRLFKLLSSRYYLMPILIFAVMAWGWKILLTLTGHDGW